MSHSLKHLFTALSMVLFMAAAPGVAHAQQTRFPSADAAAEAFVAILGADYRKVLPLDDVSPDDKLDFLAAWVQGHRVVAQGDNVAVLEVGKTQWTLPIPMVKGAGGWAFDTRAGADELMTRRIGRNELAAMEAVLAYSAATNPDGAFHGHYFRILTGQGRNANGGAGDAALRSRCQLAGGGAGLRPGSRRDQVAQAIPRSRRVYTALRRLPGADEAACTTSR